MRTINFFNRKGGVGSTLYASHTVFYGHALGRSTLGISLDQNRLFWVLGGRGLRAEPLFAKRAGCATQNSMHRSSAWALHGA